jgi:hypothetical protein
MIEDTLALPGGSARVPQCALYDAGRGFRLIDFAARDQGVRSSGRGRQARDGQTRSGHPRSTDAWEREVGSALHGAAVEAGEGVARGHGSPSATVALTPSGAPWAWAVAGL